MNNFEIFFFSKYIPEDQEIKGIIHKHIIEILKKLLFWLSLALIPVFLYYQSGSIKIIFPFYFLEFYLIFIYFKIIYEIFNWYNDVWIITDSGIIDLKWALFRKKINNVGFENIEGISIEQNGFIDSFLKIGDLVVHKIGDDDFILENVYKPLLGVDLIEELTSLKEEEKTNITEERFNMLINTLGGFMEGYFGKNKDDEQKIQEQIEKIKDDETTIDLR